MELDDGVVNLATKFAKAEVFEAGVQRRNEFDDGGAFLVNPDVAFELEWVVAAMELDGGRGRRAGNGFEMDLKDGATVDGFFGGGFEDIAGLVIFVEDEEHAGETVGDEKSFVGIAKGSLAGFAGLGEAKRAAAAAGLHLVFEGGFFAIHGLVVLADNGLGDVFGADDVGSLFEEAIDQLARVNDGGDGTRKKLGIWRAGGRIA